MKLVNKLILSLSVLLFGSANLFAQGGGNLRGTVRDAEGNVLPGAAIFVEGTTIGTATDINGAYLLQNIPTGKRQITVNYIGYEDVAETFDFSAGETKIYDVVMSDLNQGIEQVTVTAIIDGQQRALNQQKMADNQMQVISADQIGMFPDLNVADALKRVSGVTSDGENIALRGTPSNFTNINMNGEQMVGTGEGGYRTPSLDFIPSDVLASLEVQKTLLPSNDGDAIGGVINLRSSEARSLKPRVNVDLGPGYNFLREKMSYNGKIGYEQRFRPTEKNPYGTFGISAKYSYFNSWSGYDRLDANAWLEKSVSTPDGDIKQYMPTDFRYRYVETNSVRNGGSLVFDWAPTVNTKFVLLGSVNSYNVDSDRNRNRVRFRGNYWSLTDREGFGPNAIGTDRISEMVQYTNVSENTLNYNIQLNGESVIGNWKIDGAVGYSSSEKKYESMAYTFGTPDYRANGKAINGTGKPAMQLDKNTIVGYVPDVTSPYLQMEYMQDLLAKVGADKIGGRDNYWLTSTEEWNHTTRGENLTVRANAAFNHSIRGNASTLSFGVKAKILHNDGVSPFSGGGNNTYSLPKNGYGDEALAMSHFLKNDLTSSNYLDGHMKYTYTLDGDKLEAFRRQNFDNKMTVNNNTAQEQSDAYYFDAREDIYAGYVMEKIQLKKLMILAGARLEHNKVKYEAYDIFAYDKDVDLSTNPSGQKPDAEEPVYSAYTKTLKKDSKSYTMVLPNVQFKYNLNNSTIFRLAYTTGYARPNAIDLVPKTTRNLNAGVITIGNPNLEASYSHNLDFMGEHYLRNVGLISGGFFYKNIDKFHYLSQMPLPSDNRYAYDDSPYVMLRQQMNGKSATVYGVEVTLNSALTFLPSFLKNLVFTGNYTYVHSSAEVERMSDDSVGESVKDKLRLPGQASHTANLALAYSCKLFTLQASYNYIGEYIQSLGANSDMDVWLQGRWQLDLNGSVQLCKGLTFYVEAQNVLNSKKFQYMGNSSRVYELRYSGAVARCGFTYKF